MSGIEIVEQLFLNIFLDKELMQYYCRWQHRFFDFLVGFIY